MNSILEYRTDRLEETVHRDHEPRIRQLEESSAKVAGYAALGAVIGSAIITAVINYFIR